MNFKGFVCTVWGLTAFPLLLVGIIVRKRSTSQLGAPKHEAVMKLAPKHCLNSVC